MRQQFPILTKVCLQVWEFDDKKLCRGFIVTPLIAEPFEVDVVHSNPHLAKPSHSTDHCKSTYPTESITNPITGLVVHPVDLQTVSPSVIPLYTAVRLSATATNNDWWESSLTQRRSQKDEPQWAAEIQKKVNATVTLDSADRVEDGGSESGDDGIERDEGIVKPENKDQSEDEDEEDNDTSGVGGGSFQDRNQGQVDAYTGPEVHPLRMCLWGIATSPGGGSTAILVTSQNTQKPERGTWNHHHCQILFEFSTRHGKPEPTGGVERDSAGAGKNDEDGSGENTVDVEGLSTEARLWEWLYGSGPGVPALTYYASHAPSTTVSNPCAAAHQTRDVEAQAQRDKIKSLFTSLVAGQTCGICADGRTKFLRDASDNDNNERQLDCACEHGHRVAVCGASGLAIMEPGISRCCGVCQSRCIDVEILAGMLDVAGKREEAEMVRKEVNGDFCVQCGGKYLD